MDAEQVLAFRLARVGLASRSAAGLGDALATPASDFARDAALLAVAARVQDMSRERWEAAVDGGEVVVAHAPRGAIHALAPGDEALLGRALLAGRDEELGVQLGRQVQRLAAEHGFSPVAALEEVAEAIRAVLAGGSALDRVALHEALRGEVRRAELLPWCEGCQSHHVAPMLWRFGTLAAGARLDAQRRYRLADAPTTLPTAREAMAGEAVRRFLRAYGPARPAAFAAWAGLAPAHGRRLWDAVGSELVEVEGGGWLLSADADALAAPPAAEGLRLLPPGDPYLSLPNRPLLAPDPALRKRLFRPVGSPGAVLVDGRLAGLWRVKAKGRKAELAVEALDGALPRAALEEEAERIARLRGATEAVLVLA